MWWMWIIHHKNSFIAQSVLILTYVWIVIREKRFFRKGKQNNLFLKLFKERNPRGNWGQLQDEKPILFLEAVIYTINHVSLKTFRFHNKYSWWNGSYRRIKDRVRDLQVCIFIKKRLQHRCFHVKVATFLRTPILKDICEWLRLCFPTTCKLQDTGKVKINENISLERVKRRDIKYLGRGPRGFLWGSWNILGIYWWIMKYFSKFSIGHKIFSHVLFS